MATNKTQFDVIADVNVQVGQVSTKGIIPKIRKALDTAIKKIKPINLRIRVNAGNNVKISTSGLVSKIRAAVANAIKKIAAIPVRIKLDLSRVTVSTTGVVTRVRKSLKDLFSKAIITVPIKLDFTSAKIITTGLVSKARKQIQTLFKNAKVVPVTLRLALNPKNISNTAGGSPGNPPDKINQTAKAANNLNQTKKEGNKVTREATRTTQNQQTALQGLSKELGLSLKILLRYTVIFEIFRSVTRAISATVGSVIGLQDALVSIQAVANLTATQMVSVETAIKDVATTTRFTTTEIAKSAQVLAQAGVGAEKIASTLTAVANFASATNATLAVSADIISTFQNVFNDLTVDDIADKLTNAVNISKLTPTGIQTIVSRLLQVTKAYNLAADQVLGAITTLRNVGIKDSTVSTGLRQSILELLAPDAKTLAVLEKRYEAIGQDLSKSAIKNLFSTFKDEDNPLLAVINELEKLGIQGSGAGDFERVFDIRAQNVINALIDNKKQFLENTEAINRTGSAAKGAAKQLDSAKNAFSNLGAVISVLADDAFRPFVEGAGNAANAITEFFKTLRKERKDAVRESIGRSEPEKRSARVSNFGFGTEVAPPTTQERSQVLAEGVEDAKKAVSDARSKLNSAGAFKENIDDALQATKTASEAIELLLGGNFNSNAQAEALVGEAINASKDVDSQSFKNFITNISKALKIQEEALNPAQLASALQDAQTQVTKAESVRLELVKQFDQALEADKDDEGAKRVIAAVNALSEAQRKLLLSNIQDLESAEAFLLSAPSDITDIGQITKDLQQANIDLLQAQDQQFVNLLLDTDAGVPADVNKLRATLSKQVAEGQTLFISKYFEVIASLITQDSTQTLLDAAKSNVDQVFQNSLDAFKKRVEASIPKEDETAATFEETLVKNRAKADREEREKPQRELKLEQLNSELSSVQESSIALINDANEQLKTFANTAEGLQEKEAFISKTKDEQAKLEKRRKDILLKINNTKEKELNFSEQFEQAQRDNIINLGEIQQLEDDLKKAKDAQLQDVDLQAKLTKDIAIAQSNQLEIEQKIIKAELDRLSKEEGFGDTSALTTDELLQQFNNPENADILQISKEFGAVLKKAVETRGALNDVEQDLTQDLDNIRRKALQAQLSTAQTAFRTASGETQKVESELSQAATRLATARDSLTKELNKQAKLGAFFDNLRSSVSGKPIGAGDVEDSIDRARDASDPSSRIELAKSAASTAAGLQTSGTISKSRAESLIRESEKIAERAQEELVQSQRAVVQAAELRERTLTMQHQEAVASESKLKESVDSLKASIDALAGSTALETTQALNTAAKDSSGSVTRGKFPTLQEQIAAGGSFSISDNAGREVTSGTRIQSTGVSDTGKANSFGDGTSLPSLGRAQNPEAERKAFFGSFAEGGLIRGPGTSTSDSVGINVSRKEFVQPADATSFYGVDFMEKLRKMEIPIEQVRAITAPESPNLSVSNKLLDSLVQRSGATPVSFTFEGSSINTQADPKDISGFKRQLAIQALKSGKRFN